MLTIIPYTTAHQKHFELLNKAWIEKHFWLEAVDKAVLENPEEHIIAHGGKILVALWNGEVAGVVALKPVENGWMEMTKMAVDAPFQGKKIGEALVRACVDECKRMGIRRLILYSNTVLQNAIHLYRKVGFTETLPRLTTYERSDIRMDMPLAPFNAEERRQLLYEYGIAYDDISTALKGLPREMWHWRESPERWNIHEILLHLADSEANSYLRARRIIAEPGSVINAYDENRWATQLKYESQSVEEAMELFKVLRRNTYHLIKDLPEHVWSQSAIHSESGPMTLDKWLWIYANHNHIGQMKRIYNHWKIDS